MIIIWVMYPSSKHAKIGSPNSVTFSWKTSCCKPEMAALTSNEPFFRLQNIPALRTWNMRWRGSALWKTRKIIPNIIGSNSDQFTYDDLAEGGPVYSGARCGAVTQIASRPNEWPPSKIYPGNISRATWKLGPVVSRFKIICYKICTAI